MTNTTRIITAPLHFALLDGHRGTFHLRDGRGPLTGELELRSGIDGAIVDPETRELIAYVYWRELERVELTR